MKAETNRYIPQQLAAQLELVLLSTSLNSKNAIPSGNHRLTLRIARNSELVLVHGILC